jgi:hypothetical protein
MCDLLLDLYLKDYFKDSHDNKQSKLIVLQFITMGVFVISSTKAPVDDLGTKA